MEPKGSRVNSEIDREGIVEHLGHIFNCHGEWAMAGPLMASLLLVGQWIKMKWGGLSENR